MEEINTPNLEALESEELRQCETVFLRLAAIARHTLDARRLRLEGQIVAAIREEQAADDQYQQLPASVRY